MGRSYPRYPDGGSIGTRPLDIDGAEIVAHSVVGSPAQTVAHAVLELAPRLPDLTICGINAGENIGLALSGSGTVGGALEAAGFGIPALAVSQALPLTPGDDVGDAGDDANAGIHFVRLFARAILSRSLPREAWIVNVNLPVGVTPETPIRQTVQSDQNYFDFARLVREDRAAPAPLAVARAYDGNRLTSDSDIRAVCIDAVVSYTLLRRDMSCAVPWRP